MAFYRFTLIYIPSKPRVGTETGANKMASIGVGGPLPLVGVLGAFSAYSSLPVRKELQRVCSPTISPKINYKASISSFE